MARLISTMSNVKLGIKIITKFSDGNIDTKSFFEGEVIDGLRYVSNGTIMTLTGKLKKIGFKFNKVSYANESAISLRSKLANEINIYMLEMDASKKYESEVVFVNPKEVIEFASTSGEVVKVDVVPDIKSTLKLVYSDNTTKEIDLTVGSDFEDLVFMNGSKEMKVSGRLKVVNYFLTPRKELGITGIMLTSNGVVFNIPAIAIKDLGKVSEVMDKDQKISEVLASVSTEELTVLTVPAGKYSDELTFSSDVKIRGVNSGISAATGARKSQKIDSGETVISGKINVSDGNVMELDGVTLTGDAAVSVLKSKNVALTNCKFVDVVPTAKKSYLVKGDKQEEPAKLIIENCFFGDNVETDGMAYYNLFELNTVLADGSRISNNYFAKACCNHNLINVYNVAEGATVEISNNHFEYSGNAIRIGIIGEPECTINVFDNSYDETDPYNNGEYAGLLLIQSYGQATTSWNNCKINIDRTKHNDNMQVWYTYTGGNDTPINETNCPTVTVDGVVVMKSVPPVTEETPENVETSEDETKTE